MVRESGAEGLVGDHRSSQGDKPNRGSGLEGVGDELVWALGLALEPVTFMAHTMTLSHTMAAKTKGGDHPVTAGGSGASGLLCSSDCAP